MKYELKPILIVYLSLLRIVQDLVCLRTFFELLFCFWVSFVFVRVPF